MSAPLSLPTPLHWFERCLDDALLAACCAAAAIHPATADDGDQRRIYNAAAVELDHRADVFWQLHTELGGAA